MVDWTNKQQILPHKNEFNKQLVSPISKQLNSSKWTLRTTCHSLFIWEQEWLKGVLLPTVGSLVDNRAYFAFFYVRKVAHSYVAVAG